MKSTPRVLPSRQQVAAECWEIQEGIKTGKVKVVDAVERTNAIGKLIAIAKQHTVDWALCHRTGGQFAPLLPDENGGDELLLDAPLTIGTPSPKKKLV